MKKDHWIRLSEGWNPFPFQITGWISAERDGRVRQDYDDEGRLVLQITDKGRAWVKEKYQTDPPA